MAHLRRPLGVALGLNTIVLLVEAAGGIRSNSLSLMFDAVHNGSDEIGLACLLLAHTSRRGLSGNFLRAANLFNGLGLLAVSGFFFWRAIEHLFHPPPVLGVIPIAAGLLGAVGNWGVARALRESSREDPAIRLAYVHNVTDVLMSLAPVLAGVLVVVCRNFLFDPLIALMIGVVVVISTCRTLVESRRKLLWPESVACGPRASAAPKPSHEIVA